MKRPVLEVIMLGGFSILYDGKPLSLGRKPAAKYFQLLQILLLQPDYTISKELLGNMLYPTEGLSNQNNSINNTILRLKKFLISAGLPEEDYIRSGDGLCMWASRIPLSVDVMRFRELAKKGMGAVTQEEKEEYLSQAWLCYQGEFLPMTSLEEWAIPGSLELKRTYGQVVSQLLAICQEKKDYSHCYTVAAKAAALYPFESWQLYGIDALTAKKDYDRAYELYRSTEQLYYEELGIEPSENMLRRLKAMSAYLGSGHKDLQEIRESMKQTREELEDAPGAYRCSYAGFMDVYQLTRRYLKREGKNAYLMQLAIINRKGQVMQQKFLNTYRDYLGRAVEESLRIGDAFTECEPGNFLILFVEGETSADHDRIFNRIMNRFEKYGGSRRAVQYQTASIFDENEMPEKLFPGVRYRWM